MIESCDIIKHIINKTFVDIGKETAFCSVKMDLAYCLSLQYVANLGNIIPLW
jgi:hypothetical protein